MKQGDPLSPFVFNAILNPLLELEEIKGFTIDDSHSISSLAFADDIILVADDPAKAQQLLTHSEHYFWSLGMNVAANKCASFQLVTTKCTWYVEDTNLQLADGGTIPSTAANNALSYLGGLIPPGWGCSIRVKKPNCN